MIACGYLDPGNWSTDLAAGAQFGYSLLYVLVFSNITAIILQHLAIKLGVVANIDLGKSLKY